MPTLRPIRRGLSVAALAFAVSAFPVVSSTGPAWAAEPDRILVETLGQMKKFKTQVDAVAPGDRNSANRLKRRMRLFKSRLDSSKTRDAAEYTEATELFDYLNATLDAKAKGEAAPPPPAKKAAAPAAPAAGPNKHPDPRIEAALEDMAVIEVAVAELAPGDRDTGNEYLRELKKHRTPIRAASDKEHPRWKQASERYAALDKAIQDQMYAAPAAAAKAPAPAKAAAPAVDPSKHPDQRIEKALAAMAEIEGQVATLQKGDRSTGDALLRELKQQRTPIRAASDKEHPRWKQASEQYAALEQRINDTAYAATAAAAPKAAAPAAAPAVDPSQHPDPRIEAALDAMAGIEGQVANLQKGDRSTGEALMRELKKHRTPIRATSDKAHPRWKQASEQYAVLEQRINDAAYAATAPAASAKHPDPRIEAALDAMAGLESQAATLQKGDRSTGEALLRELKKQRTPIRATSDKANPRWKQASEQYAALEKRINDTAYASTAPAASIPMPASKRPWPRSTNCSSGPAT